MKKSTAGRESPLKPAPQWWKDRFTAWLDASEWSMDSLEKRLGLKQSAISKMLKKSGQSRIVGPLCDFTGLPDPSSVEPTEDEQQLLAKFRAASPETRRLMVDIIERMSRG